MTSSDHVDQALAALAATLRGESADYREAFRSLTTEQRSRVVALLEVDGELTGAEADRAVDEAVRQHNQQMGDAGA